MIPFSVLIGKEMRYTKILNEIYQKAPDIKGGISQSRNEYIHSIKRRNRNKFSIKGRG